MDSVCEDTHIPPLSAFCKTLQVKKKKRLLQSFDANLGRAVSVGCYHSANETNTQKRYFPLITSPSSFVCCIHNSAYLSMDALCESFFLRTTAFFYDSTVCCWNDSLRKGNVYCKIMYIWRISSFILWIYLWHNLTINCLFFFIKHLFVLMLFCVVQRKKYRETAPCRQRSIYIFSF